VRRHAAAAGVTGTLRFNTIMLQEPPKAQLLAYQHGAGPKPERRALVWVLNPPKGDFFEAVVGLPEGLGAAGAAADVVHTWAKVRRSSRLYFCLAPLTEKRNVVLAVRPTCALRAATAAVVWVAAVAAQQG
jgi:hypothetical protein